MCKSLHLIDVSNYLCNLKTLLSLFSIIYTHNVLLFLFCVIENYLDKFHIKCCINDNKSDRLIIILLKIMLMYQKLKKLCTKHCNEKVLW